ncbi:secretory phospholipase A2 receptor-like [Fundulus heteroclitus]|uniref:secretory phospholipase A2 receptor-like n=1 Tax=Fundulus heteroclitus TaxID=8078 RepID=UPI00165B142F|nr:secretory phospholipase A2 receptor-like [Fundulus heteroclitus]
MMAKSWSEADTYCTDHHNGLASFEWYNMSYFSQQDIPTWIGLHRNGGSWKWSSGLEEDKQWNLAEPNNDKNCVAITSLTKRLTTQNCQTLLPFLCMKDNLVLVKENSSWEEAFEHCRSLGSSSNSGLHFNLLSVQPGDEHTYVKNKVMEADTEEVWTGLRYLGDEWLWVNGADMLYTDLPQCPILWQRCGALSKNDTGTMEARDCSERKNFLCYSYKI